MIKLGYIGNHAADTLPVRIGWAATRAVQTGKFKRVTHTESVLSGTNYKRCTIASSSARDKGVRIKENITLTKGHWIALEVPGFNADRSRSWFVLYLGCAYDWVGAIATKLPFLRPISRRFTWFFCNEACLAAFIHRADSYTPSESFDLLVSRFGAVDVTDEFFKD